MAEPTPGVVPVVLQTGDPTNSIIIIRGLLAGGQDVIFRTGAETPDLNLPPSGDVVASPAATATINTLYIGARARFVALGNGVRLEVQDDAGTWKPQIAWTEGSGLPS